jgi:hypothetical protein
MTSEFLKTIEAETGRKVRKSFSAHGLLVADDILEPKDALARKLYAFLYSACSSERGMPVQLPSPAPYFNSAYAKAALQRLESGGLIMRLQDGRFVVTFPPKEAYRE